MQMQQDLNVLHCGRFMHTCILLAIYSNTVYRMNEHASKTRKCKLHHFQQRTEEEREKDSHQTGEIGAFWERKQNTILVSFGLIHQLWLNPVYLKMNRSSAGTLQAQCKHWKCYKFRGNSFCCSSFKSVYNDRTNKLTTEHNKREKSSEQIAEFHSQLFFARSNIDTWELINRDTHTLTHICTVYAVRIWINFAREKNVRLEIKMFIFLWASNWFTIFSALLCFAMTFASCSLLNLISIVRTYFWTRVDKSILSTDRNADTGPFSQ